MNNHIRQQSNTPELARSAGLLAAGNILSRLLGLVRETVIANLFGATGYVSAYRAAELLPRLLYDLLVGGMVSSSLVPIFSEYAEKDRQSLWKLASMIITLATIILVVIILLMELAAPLIAQIMVGGLKAEYLALTVYLLRYTIPAVLLLSLSGIITSLLYSLKRFSYPAFTAALYNAGIVTVALIGAKWLGGGIEVLAIGLLVGAVLQILLQLPGLREGRLRPSFNFNHPALRRISRLYLPVIMGLVVSFIATVIDRNLASHTGDQSIAWMNYATTLVQFPLGFVSTAISIAILPTLSRMASRGDSGGFMEHLSAGLKLVIVLIVPATMGLFVLSNPLIRLIFEHGDFTPADTVQTVAALRFYLLGLIFAAIDQPLIFAFYARQNTLTPALVGIAGVGVYLVTALTPSLFRPMQMTDLVLANSAQLTAHAIIMLWLIHRVKPFNDPEIWPITGKVLLNSVLMGLLTWQSMQILSCRLTGSGLITEILMVVIPGLIGTIACLGFCMLMRIPQIEQLAGLLRLRK